MARSSTTFTKEDGRAGRTKGRKNFLTLLMESIREEAMLNATPNMGVNETQKLFIKHVAKRALDSTDPNSATLLKELMSKSYPALKATMQTVDFEFDRSAKPSEQAGQILEATASGDISPDVSQALVNNIATMMKIEEITELSDRLRALEDLLNG